MLVIATDLEYEAFMLDVQKELLNVDVEEDVFVKMAPGKEIPDRSRVSPVMKPNMSLYCLRHSPRNCLGTMDHHIARSGSAHSNRTSAFPHSKMALVLLFLYAVHG